MDKNSVNWKGVIPALVTPFDKDGAIDEGAFRLNIASMIAQGCHGILVGGCTGEFWAHTAVDAVNPTAAINSLTRRSALRMHPRCSQRNISSPRRLRRLLRPGDVSASRHPSADPVAPRSTESAQTSGFEGHRKTDGHGGIHEGVDRWVVHLTRRSSDRHLIHR